MSDDREIIFHIIYLEQECRQGQARPRCIYLGREKEVGAHESLPTLTCWTWCRSWALLPSSACAKLLQVSQLSPPPATLGSLPGAVLAMPAEVSSRGSPPPRSPQLTPGGNTKVSFCPCFWWVTCSFSGWAHQGSPLPSFW